MRKAEKISFKSVLIMGMLTVSQTTFATSEGSTEDSMSDNPGPVSAGLGAASKCAWNSGWWKLHTNKKVCKVGIGADIPKAFLHISSDKGFETPQLHLESTNPGDYSRLRFSARGLGQMPHWDIAVGGGLGANHMNFFAAGTGNIMSLNPSGNVGIGTLSPKLRLDVAAGKTQDGGVRVTTSAADAGLQLKNTGSGGKNYFIYTTGLGSVNGAGNLAFGKVGKWADVVISSDGRVGIGGAPTVVNYNAGPPLKPKLDVQGDLRVAHVPVWDGPNAHDLTWGAGFANGVAFSPDKKIISREGSSRRYKRDIEAFDEDFSKILAVKPMRYKMRNGYGPPRAMNFGYIAEDLHDAGLRNLVIYDNEGRPDGIKYKKMVVYVNEVVKRQQKTIEQLNEDLTVLKELVAAGSSPIR